MYRLNIGTKVYFNENGINQIITIAQREGYKNLGILLDQAVEKHAVVAELLGNLKAAGIQSFVRSSSQPEPTYDWLGELAQAFRSQKLDAMVGIGGGSVLDLAKALSALMTNDGEPMLYRGFDKTKNPSLPKIMVPTTAGTGSEITPNASFINAQEKVKLGINGECVRPEFAVLDPRLTLSCPRAVTVGSGIDAVVHSLEARIGLKQDWIGNIYADQALGLMLHWLPIAAKDPSSLEARSHLLLGAHFAGVALMTTSSGAAAGLSYPLGVHFNVPHGMAGAVYLREVIRWNIEKGYFFGYARAMESWDKVSANLGSDEKKARMFLDRIDALWRELSAPLTLNEFGVRTEEQIDLLYQESLKLRGALNNNPVALSDSDVREIIARLVKRS